MFVPPYAYSLDSLGTVKRVVMASAGNNKIGDVVSSAPGPVKGFALNQNFPNPFNPSTAIEFSIPSKSHVVLQVIDVLGREVATVVSEQLPAGNHVRRWDAGRLSTGVYFCRLRAGGFTETRKLTLIR